LYAASTCSAQQAQRIDPAQLQHRLSAHGLPHEIAPLVQAFNDALDRVEQGYRRLETFNADIAHELRTPLQNMIGQTEVALSRTRDAEAYRDVLQSLLEEADQLRRMTADMLFITSVQAGTVSTELIEARQEVDLVLGFFEASSEERGVRINAEGRVTLRANRGLIRRALTNLVDNALKYSAPGSGVHVQLHDEPGPVPHGLIAVRNNGPEIPADLLPHVFDRFVRGEAHRATAGGAGLGLAIVRTIMQLHGGSVSATSSKGQTEFVLRFRAE
jgi:two-component system, OmpR family, heavy metal sensor histidine kinase CusS